MQELRSPENLKVHFAGSEVATHCLLNQLLGIRYSLYTAFPFVERKIFTKPKTPLIALKSQRDNPNYTIPHYVIDNSRHTIQDSGLFTLMFGARGGQKDEKLINRWYDELVSFTLDNRIEATCVEVDCQKILSPEKAWEFRKRMRADLPQNRIINVFHIEDGLRGLDELIEFSDYIAISVPELRILGKSNRTKQIASYIKKKKPNIDIHLLGCTELRLMRACAFCTSCDSTSQTSPVRYGYLGRHHISDSLTDKVIELVGELRYNQIREYLSETNANAMILSVEYFKARYEKAAGNQDYYVSTC